MNIESESINKTLAAAKEYADLIVKGPLSEIGGFLTDTIGYWRLKNRVRLMLKAKQWLEERNVNPKKIIPDVFVPLIEEGGNAGDETLADMFASLLATHLDPEFHEHVHPSYTKVLAQISPVDAQALLEYRKYVSYSDAREVGLTGRGITVEMVANDLHLSKKTAYLSSLNLWRLGIVEHKGYLPPQKHEIPTIFGNSPEHQLYLMTEYGIAFCDACQYAKSRRNKDTESGHE